MISALTKMLATCVHAAKDTSCVPVLKGFGIAWNQALMGKRGMREAYIDVRNGHHLSPAAPAHEATMGMASMRSAGSGSTGRFGEQKAMSLWLATVTRTRKKHDGRYERKRDRRSLMRMTA